MSVPRIVITATGAVCSGGKTPRGFAIEPGGRFLIAANQHSDSVVVFAIDRATGKLSTVGAIAVGTPVDVKIVKP